MRWWRRRKIESEEELKEIISRGEEEGIITEEEEALIKSIFEIGDTPVEEVMVPRVDMVACKTDATLEDMVKLYLESGHTKIPVYEGNIDNIVGIVYIPEVLKFWKRDERIFAVDLMKLPYFIPYSKNVLQTMKEFQKNHISIAIVVDEYGGVYGLVTMEDLIEEIIGELQDELDRESTKKLEDGTLIIPANFEIERLSEIFNAKIEDMGMRTVGGLLIKKKGKIPSPGERIELDGLEVEVIEASRQRIRKLAVRKK